MYKHWFIGLLALCGIAASQAADTLRVVDPWARATPPGATTGAAFLQLTNTGEQTERLIGARSPLAERVELHTHVMESGMMRMRQVAAIDLPPGERVRLEPGGLHLMLIDLRQPLVAGERVFMTLVLERGGERELEFTVRAP
jgi:periplasmic copper chaperone A